MEEFESQTERVEEQLHEHAHHAGEKWVSGVALTAALLAALAATAAMLSGHHVNEAMLEQIKASDHWSHFQAKGIKAATVENRIDQHEVAGREVNPKDREQIQRYEQEQKDIAADAKTAEGESATHMARHTTLSKSVTLFQVAIAVSAISALTRKRAFWFVGIFLGVVGIVFLVMGVLPGGSHAAAEHAGEGPGVTHAVGAE